jgi:MoaA/NifB/PqqE/SkfB family radical SAM enzyme
MKKSINFARKIITSNIRRLRKPYKLTYAVTYQCNSKCRLCQIWKRKNFQELEFKEAELFFRKNRFFNWVDLTGGEVFLKNDLVELVELIINTQPNLYLLHIPTNGILVNRIVSQVKKILELAPHKFIISIAMDGPPDLHNQLRGVENNWQKAVKTYKQLAKLRSKKFDCYLGMTLSQYNFEKIEKTYQELKKEIPFFKRSKLHFNIAHNSNHYYQNTKIKLDINSKLIDELKKFKAKKRIKLTGVSLLENAYQGLIDNYLHDFKTPVKCQALSSSIFLNPKGDLYACGMWDKKITDLSEIDYQIKNIWSHKKVQEMYQQIRVKNCPNCWTPCEAYQSILGSLWQTIFKLVLSN